MRERTYLAYRLRETDGYKLLSNIDVYSSPFLEAARTRTSEREGTAAAVECGRKPEKKG